MNTQVESGHRSSAHNRPYLAEIGQKHNGNRYQVASVGHKSKTRFHLLSSHVFGRSKAKASMNEFAHSGRLPMERMIANRQADPS